MIRIFRDELNKWKFLLYPVFFGMIGSSFVMLTQFKTGAELGEVNGAGISTKEFERKRGEITEQIAQARYYASMLKVPVESFIRLSNLDNPAESAFQECVRDKVIETCGEGLSVVVDQATLNKALLNVVPKAFISESGELRLAEYAQYIRQHKRLYVAEFEALVERDVVRDTIESALSYGAYLPAYTTRKNVEGESILYDVLHISYDRLLKEVASESRDANAVKAFYSRETGRYRTPEERAVSYWKVEARAFEKEAAPSEEKVVAYYEKNKSSLYRIAPQVKVRRLSIDKKSDESRVRIERAEEQLRSADASLTFEKRDALFADLVGEYSTESSERRSGGMVDFFSRGTHEAPFETAALRLKTPGEVSPVVETENAYVICQLVERIGGTEKPLDAVRSEIVESLTSKKSISLAEDAVKRAARSKNTNDEACEVVRAHAGREVKVTIAVDEKSEDQFRAALVRAVVGMRPEVNGCTSFSHEGAFYLVQLTGITPAARIPFEECRGMAEKDMNQAQAKARVAEVRDAVRADLAAGLSYDEIERKHSVTHSVVSVADGEKPALFKKAPGVTARLADLVDEALMVSAADGESGWYIIRRKKVSGDEQGERAGSQKASAEEVVRYDAGYDSQERFYTEASVESLLRSATIVRRVSF